MHSNLFPKLEFMYQTFYAFWIRSSISAIYGWPFRLAAWGKKEGTKKIRLSTGRKHLVHVAGIKGKDDVLNSELQMTADPTARNNSVLRKD